MSPRVQVTESGDERLLLVDGAVQSAAVCAGAEPLGYWGAMLPGTPPSKALLLGLGGGTLAHLLRRRYPQLSITGVENDATVLALAREHFGLDTAGVTVVEDDALAYLRGCWEQYDLVLVDLFCGEALPGFVTSRAFLRRLRGVVVPGGALIWNLHRDRRGRVLRLRAQRALRLERTTLVGLNLILHLRRGRTQRQRRLKSPDSTP